MYVCAVSTPSLYFTILCYMYYVYMFEFRRAQQQQRLSHCALSSLIHYSTSVACVFGNAHAHRHTHTHGANRKVIATGASSTRTQTLHRIELHTSPSLHTCCPRRAITRLLLHVMRQHAANLPNVSRPYVGSRREQPRHQQQQFGLYLLPMEKAWRKSRA